MTIFITTIPDDPKEWATWLEQHLVGLRLRDVIDELRLLPGSASTPLNGLLDQKQLLQVRQRGLSALSVNQVRALLGSPESLLELQDDVLLRGSDYWASLPPSAEVQHAADRVRKRLGKSPIAKERAAVPAAKPDIKHRSRGLSIALTSVAALLLIGLLTWQIQPRGSGSILGQPGLLANDVSSSAEYLNRIANAGSEWFNQNPRDSAELVTLLENVSNDCQILIDAEHKALTPKDRDWFIEKCENWKNKFDTTLASLQSGQLTFDAAKAEADKTMMKLVNVLREGPAV
ncbi:MAG: hypothetical protein JNL58_27040 [Planctomyces sp.]|nr:hypothetical protein [Planctomyces sp.]